MRYSLGRFLVGDGVEVGPGHYPFPLAGDATRVRYVDRNAPDRNRELFPELGDASFPMPDVIADLDRDKLRAFDDNSLDFVIASHVFEHLADPIGLLDDVHRALRSGGSVLILLPDRRRTFDVVRPGTAIEHLVADHHAAPTTVDDAHVEAYLREMGTWDEKASTEQKAAHIAHDRDRSFHVHCWTEDEFPTVLGHALDRLNHRWELLDASFVQDYPNSDEFGYVMRKVPHGVDIDLAANFRRIWHLLRVETAWRAGVV